MGTHTANALSLSGGKFEQDEPDLLYACLGMYYPCLL